MQAAAHFLAMWSVMMTAMMLPSVAPALRRYSVASRKPALTAVVGASYFAVWSAAGLVVFALGTFVVALQVRLPLIQPARPLLAGLGVALAGVLQMSAWKSRHLACCREAKVSSKADIRKALVHGLRLGVHCNLCCASFTAAMVLLGMMDLRVMVLTTAGITLERLAGERAAHLIGTVVVLAGAFIIVRAIV